MAGPSCFTGKTPLALCEEVIIIEWKGATIVLEADEFLDVGGQEAAKTADLVELEFALGDLPVDPPVIDVE